MLPIKHELKYYDKYYVYSTIVNLWLSSKLQNLFLRLDGSRVRSAVCDTTHYARRPSVGGLSAGHLC